MGQAKRRGTYEQRKAAAEERNLREQVERSQLLRRRPSPRHLALLNLFAAIAQLPGRHPPNARVL